MIGIRGSHTTIAQALRALITDPVLELGRGATTHLCDRYLFAAGLATTETRSNDPLSEVWWANAGEVIQACDAIFARNPIARVCVIGSEAAYSPSFDHAYAAAKAAVHRYVESKRLGPSQQLVAIAPALIADAGMTARRSDTEELERRRMAHPQQRWVTSAEVAQLVQYLLYVDRGYLTGTVIRLHGGGR